LTAHGSDNLMIAVVTAGTAPHGRRFSAIRRTAGLVQYS
jgi:hypothetical protein